MNTQKRIFELYKEIHSDILDKDDKSKQKFFNNLVKYIYLKHLEDFKEKKILEIGCNKGYFLKALKDNGFRNLYGIDLSAGSIKIAKEKTGISTLYCEDLFDHLSKNKYDVIIAKDVMEHIPKDKQENFVSLLFNSLNEDGKAIIQVPNMDWIMSNHERYMDFTHEIGYTRESLGEIFRLYFKNIKILPVSYVFPSNLKAKIIYGLIRPLFINFLRLIFKIIGEGAENVWFECREIMVIAEK
ncbi:MAG: class I SAM-dependent methyltransferase [candidate division WOR-3 bacterium]